MGQEGLDHDMTLQHLKRIRQLEKENNALKQLVAQKELENKQAPAFTLLQKKETKIDLLCNI
jgi:hypothetical protein